MKMISLISFPKTNRYYQYMMSFSNLISSTALKLNWNYKSTILELSELEKEQGTRNISISFQMRKKWWNGHRKVSNLLKKDEEGKLKKKMRIINWQLIKKMIKSQQKNGHPLRKCKTAAGAGNYTLSAVWVWPAPVPAPTPAPLRRCR